jgi:hypothetical protein
VATGIEGDWDLVVGLYGEAHIAVLLSIRGCESKQQLIEMYSKSLASFIGTDFCTSL